MVYLSRTSTAKSLIKVIISKKKKRKSCENEMKLIHSGEIVLVIQICKFQ